MKRLRFLIISILLIPVMLSGSMISLSAEESPVWDGKSAEEFAGGTGTAEDPYIIQTPQQLMFFQEASVSELLLTKTNMLNWPTTSF